MKSVDIRRVARLIAPAFLALSGLWLALPLRAQTYHNITNQKFRTVANGPQSALIVDVADPTDTAAVRKAAMAQFNAVLSNQSPALQKQIAMMRKRHLIRPTQRLDYVTAAIARSNGRLALAPVRHTRAGGPPGGNDIKFIFPTSGANAWDVATASYLDNLANTILKPEMKQVLGPPLWSDTPNSGLATVTVLNSDPRVDFADAPLGALLTISVDANKNPVVQVLFPGGFGDDQSKFLAMAQVMAQAFHGPFRIGYDAWEQGMARAAAVIAAKDINTFNGTALDPTNGFFYTPNYDLDNQPALGNNTFTPPTISNQPNNHSYQGLLIPRMEMSSMAWLKCYIENTNFFRSFNSAYFDADSANTAVANDVNALRAIAKSVVPNVEAQPFDTWFELQYVLDTSVTVGPKIYAYTTPTFPDDPQFNTGDDIGGGASVYLFYYNTSLTGTGLGDESGLNATINPLYWDFNFQNRLTPAIGSDPISIVDGFGTVAPVFTNIGGTPADQMRIFMDFPANREYVRVAFPTGQTGTDAAPNDFSGVLVGADAGTLTVQFDNNTTKTLSVVQGEFGGTGAPQNAFSRDRFVFAQTGGSPLTFQRNMLHRTNTAAPVFKFIAPAPLTTLTNTFGNGPRMISLPIKPILPDIAKALGTDPTTLLLAQYRQDLNTDPKYQFYPSLPSYQPGYGLWSNLNQNLQSTITGNSTDVEQDLSVPLLFGWNQIGSPYNVTPGLNATTTDITFSYRGSETVSLATAISNGWVGTSIYAFSPSSGYVNILDTSSPDASIPLNTLEPWKGYWIRVTVTEGITIVYSNPTNRSARAMKLSRSISKPTREPGSWSIPLTVRDANGVASSAVFGQANSGSDSFDPRIDAASPPVFSRAAMLGVRFPHTDWDTGNGIGGDFLTDIRRSGTHSEWNVTVNVPLAQQPYTLSWADTAKMAKGTRLTLVDKSAGSRTVMNTTSSYAFTPAKGETTRQFQIIAEPRKATSLFIRNTTISQTPAISGRAVASTVIRYELSTDAQTSVNIRQGGSIIRHLTATRAATAGNNEVLWDLKNDHGVPMTANAYMLEITAQTAEGERTRTILPIVISR